jgi:NTP pyrophosphatase (non-canonical NTP hydrolase)
MRTMDAPPLTIANFQRHISDRYESADRARGTAGTFLWFIEEVGELATALHGNDRGNLEEEFADVLAWLCTLANINDVDLSAAVTRKYLSGGGPSGHK